MLSSVDAQVQRQLLLGQSAQGIPNATIITLPLHATMISQGQVPNHMLLVLNGRIKIWRSLPSPQSPSALGNLADAQAIAPNHRRPSASAGLTDTVLTECVGELSEGGVMLEAETALALPALYTAMIANPAFSDGAGSPEEARQRECEVLSVTSDALHGESASIGLDRCHFLGCLMCFSGMIPHSGSCLTKARRQVDGQFVIEQRLSR